MRTKAKNTVVVYLDTNIIFSDGWCEFIRKEIGDLVAKHSKHATIQLSWRLPLLALEERIFRHYLTAQKQAKGTEELSKVLPLLPAAIDREHLLRAVTDLATKECRDKGITVLPLPTELDWPDIVRRSVMREPPFNPSIEKEAGFRDAVICAMFKADADSLPKGSVAIFASEDGLVKSTCSEFKLPCKTLFASNSDEIDEHLAKVSSHETEDHLKFVKDQAKAKFFTPGDQDSYYIVWKIRSRVNLELDKLAGKLHESETVQNKKFSIFPPTLTAVEGATFKWSSVIKVVVETHRKPAAFEFLMRKELDLAPGAEPAPQTYDMEFRVTWSFKVREDKVVMSPTFGDVQLLKDSISSRVALEDAMRLQLFQELRKRLPGGDSPPSMGVPEDPSSS